MTPAEWTAGIAVIAALVGPLITARVMRKPSADEALTKRFEALIDRQEEERQHLTADFEKREKKLERVAGELEVMVLRLIEWADEVTVKAKRRGVDLPPRPKFRDVTGASS